MQDRNLRQPTFRASERFATASGCWCHAAEPELGDLLRDPMMRALMEADRVDRRDLDALFDWARDSLRLNRR